MTTSFWMLTVLIGLAVVLLYDQWQRRHSEDRDLRSRSRIDALSAVFQMLSK